MISGLFSLSPDGTALDPAVHGAQMEDRFYNNKAFQVSKSVLSGEVELAWRRGSVMDCHATAWGSIPCEKVVFTELHVLCKGQ